MRTAHKIISVLFALLIFSLLLSACKRDPNAPKAPGDIKFWLYQLQDADINAILQSGFDRVVMDYAKDGSDETQYPAQQITSLIKADILPIAYLSIGEAENYRFYWNQAWVATPNSNDFTAEAPLWLGRTNPDWQGNYKVRYWHPDWQNNYIRLYLDKIIAQGFRGVYLDIIDSFEYWADRENYGVGKEVRRPDDPYDDEAEAAHKMIRFVRWIAEYCRARSPFGAAFLVIPQNGERILQYDDEGEYLAAISGIGIEDLWYNETNPIAAIDVAERLAWIEKVQAAGKWVLSVDYVDNGDHQDSSNLERISDYLSRCSRKGFFCYAARTNRDLDFINFIKGVQP